MDYSKLKVIMKEKKITYEFMAKELNLTLQGFANKINRKYKNKGGFYVDEAKQMKKILDLTEDEAIEIFLN